MADGPQTCQAFLLQFLVIKSYYLVEFCEYNVYNKYMIVTRKIYSAQATSHPQRPRGGQLGQEELKFE